jgi:hypothetical protein
MLCDVIREVIVRPVARVGWFDKFAVRVAVMLAGKCGGSSHSSLTA